MMLQTYKKPQDSRYLLPFQVHPLHELLLLERLLHELQLKKLHLLHNRNKVLAGQQQDQQAMSTTQLVTVVVAMFTTPLVTMARTTTGS